MRKQTLIVMLLAVLCGTSAAFGVHQLLKNRGTQTRVIPAEVKTKPVIAAAQKIERATVIDASLLKVTEWPEEFVPPNVYSTVDEVVGMVATSDLEAEAPIFAANLADKSGGGFMSSFVQEGMRAYTIETSGASASVAGFVRPTDYVDVLLTLRSSKEDTLGGGTTIPLLEGIQILAINQITEVNPDRFTMLLSGSQVSSVTLLVTQVEARLLALGQDAGELSLALRKPDDPSNQVTPRTDLEPTMAAISKAIIIKEKAAHSLASNSAVKHTTLKIPETPEPTDQVEQPVESSRSPAEDERAFRPGYIRTSRAGQPGRIPIRLSK